MGPCTRKLTLRKLPIGKLDGFTYLQLDRGLTTVLNAQSVKGGYQGRRCARRHSERGKSRAESRNATRGAALYAERNVSGTVDGGLSTGANGRVIAVCGTAEGEICASL